MLRKRDSKPPSDPDPFYIARYRLRFSPSPKLLVANFVFDVSGTWLCPGPCACASYRRREYYKRDEYDYPHDNNEDQDHGS